MAILLVFLVGITLFKIKPQSKNDNNTFLDREVTLSISGIFVLIVFLRHFFSYLPLDSFSIIDKPAKLSTSFLGQLIVTPFLFYSGYGIFEKYKSNGERYADTLPKKRIFKVYLSFLIAWLMFAILALILKSNYSISDYLLSITGIRSIGNSNWYVVVILSLYITSYLSFKLCGGNITFSLVLQTIFSLLLLLVLKKSGLESYWWNTIPAYLFGIYFSFFKERIISFLKHNKIVPWLCLALSICLFATFYYVIPKFLFSNQIVYTCTILFFLSSIVLFTYLFQIKNKVLLWLGKHCFWIYILQRLPMIAFARVGFIYSNRYIYLVACFIATLGIAWLFKMVFDKTWNLAVVNKGQTSESNNVKLGIVISYISLAVSIISAFIVTPRILKALGDVQYGLYSFANSITTWLTVISTALAASYIRFATKSAKEEGGTSKVNTLYFKVFALIAFAVIVLSVSFLAVGLFGWIKLKQYSDQENLLIFVLLFISGIQIAINVLFSTFGHYLTYKRQFIFTRSLSLITSILSHALCLVFALVTHSVISIAIISVVIGVITTLANVVFSFRSQNISFSKCLIKEESKTIKSIIIFSGFILLNAVVDRINHEVDKTILGIMVDAETVTTYTLARYFNSYLMTISVSISGTFTPKIHELVTNNKKEELNALFLKVSSSQLLIVCLIVGGFISCGLPFVNLWLGDGRENVYYHAIPFLLLDVVCLSCNFGIEVQRAMNKHKFRAVLYIVLASINVGISILLVYLLPKEYAIWGVTAGTVFSVVSGNWIILNIYNKKVAGLHIGTYFINLLKYVAYAGLGIGLSYVVALFLPPLSNIVLFLIEGGIFVLIYFLMLLIFERKTLLYYFKKIRG